MAPTFDRIDQWLDWGDHTRTVDPIGNARWIHDGNWAHMATLERGREYDARDVKHLQQLLSNTGTPTDLKYFTPTFGQLQGLPRFEVRQDSQTVCRNKIHSLRGDGELPAIAEMLWQNELPDAGRGTIERQVYRASHMQSAKAFSRSGVPDHGVPSSTNTNFSLQQ